MSFINFAWTSAALLCDAKTVTRRAWQTRYANQFHRGQLVDAYNRSPRNGGTKIAVIRLTETPQLQNTILMPDEDYHAEGYAWLAQHKQLWPRTIHGHPCAPDEFDFDGGWARWKLASEHMWVVRFEVVRKLVDVPCTEPVRNAV